LDASDTHGLETVVDFVRFGASRFAAAGLVFGHGYDNAVDEALALVRHVLHFGPDSPAEFYGARLTRPEKAAIAALFQRRLDERIPAAYLTGTAWFAGLEFAVDSRVLVPRSPIAELIEAGFEPWIDPARVGRILDLCTGSGCIGIACAFAFPDAQVDLADVSAGALEVAQENIDRFGVGDRVAAVNSDLFAGLSGRTYDLIVTNPPYVDAREMAELAPEFAHEPRLGLAAGDDGLEVVRRIIAEARAHLAEQGHLFVEVGASRPAMEAAFPDLPLTWIEFERGGGGVFHLGAGDLEA
jgi:ribosomal protein L3 glutamine methyltransferase